MIDLTDKVHDGNLYWDVPEGKWRIFIRYITRNDGGNPDYINIIDREYGRKGERNY